MKPHATIRLGIDLSPEAFEELRASAVEHGRTPAMELTTIIQGTLNHHPALGGLRSLVFPLEGGE
jgi:hypothetical protein